MELRQLEYFVAVAEDLNFSRAATRLHIAQPSISAQIKALETELEVRLFDRSSKAVSLSPAGLELLPLARELLDDARQLREQERLSARRLGGKVRIGFLADEYASPTGERVMASMRRQHPRIAIEFHQVDFAEHHSVLSEGQVDVAFVMGPVPIQFDSVPIGQSHRLLAVSRALLDDGETTPPATRVHGQAVVLPNRMTSHQWRRSWLPPDTPEGQVFVVGEDSMEAVLAAVGARRGVAVVPEYVSRYYPQPGVAFMTIDRLDPCSVEIATLHARESEPVIRALMQVARGSVGARSGRPPRTVAPPS